MSDRETRYYRHNLDHGELTLTVPEKLSESDVDDIEAHFALTIRQCRRRQKSSGPKSQSEDGEAE